MRKLIAPLLLLFLVAAVFRNWFLPGVISAFDFPYFSKLMMRESTLTQYAWGYHPGLGLSQFLSPYSWVFPLIYFPQVLFRDFGLDWSQVTRISYLIPILILAIFTPSILFRKIFPENKFYFISVLVYSFNTFALLLFSGQVFLSISYGLFPLIFYIFIELLENQRSLFNSVLLGLLVSLSLMADPRVTYVALFSLILYFFSHLLYSNVLKNIGIRKLFLHTFLIPGFVIVLLQSFWIIPTILYGANPVKKMGTAFSTQTAVNYLSFAKFENTISLLHPNWPENIFGKTYFMRPEFLLLPILAFSSLLFLSKIKDRKTKFNISFFAFLGLLGAFLAKGSNPPFGEIYVWLFNYFPGFIMFRDASKWYLLVAISYAVLIPLTISYIYYSNVLKNIRMRLKLPVYKIFLFLIILYLIFLIRPALFGQLGGTFKTTNIPDDYFALEKFLSSQNDFFRTLWFPSNQRFGYYSNNHPKLSANNFLNAYNYPELLEDLSKSNTLLDETSVKYVVVPYDSLGEIFLTDRKYDNSKYLNAIQNLSKISWLKRVNCCGRVAVFENSNFKDHFWSPQGNFKINYTYVNPTLYKVSVENAGKGDLLVFSESFDNKWTARIPSIKYQEESRKYKDKFNTFILPKAGNYLLEIYYTPQDWVNIGSLISIISLAGVLVLLIYLYRKK